MSLLSAALSGLLMGVVVSIPPGPAGVIILHRSLHGEKRRAGHAVAAYLAAELSALLVTLAFLERLAWLAALPFMRPLAGAYLVGFAVSAWRAAGADRGFAETSPLGVFRLTILNPAIWIGAVSTLTIARATSGAGLLLRAGFVAAFELGCLAWYLAVILGARAVPGAFRRHVQRAAVLVIGATGVWFIASVL
jgi:threonine/homoserine/homoserine lactone efflux protein